MSTLQPSLMDLTADCHACSPRRPRIVFSTGLARLRITRTSLCRHHGSHGRAAAPRTHLQRTRGGAGAARLDRRWSTRSSCWCWTAQQTTEFLLLFAFIPRVMTQASCRSRSGRADMRPTSGRSSLTRSSTAISITCSSTRMWLLAFGSPVARRFGTLALSRVLRRHGSSRRRRAPCHPFRRGAADGRRLGGDLRRDGGIDAVCVSARRSARAVGRPRRGLPGAGSAAHRGAARSARARLPAGVVRHQCVVRH